MLCFIVAGNENLIESCHQVFWLSENDLSWFLDALSLLFPFSKASNASKAATSTPHLLPLRSNVVAPWFSKVLPSTCVSLGYTQVKPQIKRVSNCEATSQGYCAILLAWWLSDNQIQNQVQNPILMVSFLEHFYTFLVNKTWGKAGVLCFIYW